MGGAAPVLETAWLADPRTQAVTAMLEAAGHQALFVGGCVRNALLGIEGGDVDIATDARPEAVVALAASAGLKTAPTGIAHGTVTVISDHHPYEVTTFRHDVATDGRRAVVAFGADLREDANRRDFTMNALYARPDGRVLDPVGSGLADLAARRVRFVGEPDRRIAEDYLRILRLFRFHAHYGDPAAGIDPAALAAASAGRDGLGRLSRERVGAELAKLLAARDPAPAVAAMAAAGVLERVLAGADAGALEGLVGAEASAGLAPDWRRRLAALGPVAPWIEALRLSKADSRRLAAIEAAAASTEPPAALAYRYGEEAVRDALVIRAARGSAPPPGWDAAIATGAAAHFPLRAADLPGLEGPALGAELRRLEAEWVASGFALDRVALLARRRPG